MQIITNDGKNKQQTLSNTKSIGLKVNTTKIKAVLFNDYNEITLNIDKTTISAEL